MFRNSYQNGFFSIFYSIGSNPLSIWKCQIKDGHSKRITDSDINSLVLELISRNATITFITAPLIPHQSLAIKLPFITLIIKNLQKYFSFEIQIRDSENQLRRFQASNFQKRTCVNIFCVQMPLKLSTDWNQIQINLADFTHRAFGTNYLETVRVRINANVRLRHVYFTDRMYADNEKPKEYRLQLVNKNKMDIDRVCNEVSVAPPTTPVCQSPRFDDCYDVSECKIHKCSAPCSNVRNEM